MNHLGNSKTDAPSAAEEPTIINALCVLAFATECGINPEALAARSGIRIDLICQIADNMRGAGL